VAHVEDDEADVALHLPCKVYKKIIDHVLHVEDEEANVALHLSGK